MTLKGHFWLFEQFGWGAYSGILDRISWNQNQVSKYCVVATTSTLKKWHSAPLKCSLIMKRPIYIYIYINRETNPNCYYVSPCLLLHIILWWIRLYYLDFWWIELSRWPDLCFSDHQPLEYSPSSFSDHNPWVYS